MTLVLTRVCQCALTKLGYLLSKPDLSVTQVRTLMGTPLRGELTLPASNIPKTLSTSADINSSLDSIQGVLSHVVRLATSKSAAPTILISPTADLTTTGAADESAAAWSWTAAQAASTELALLPLLMHLAAARDDIRSLHFCLAADTAEVAASPDLSKPESTRRGVGAGTVLGGMANCIDPASGRSPLHVAALNGSVGAVNALLEAGALVHLRDALGHTALYYVRLGVFNSTSCCSC